MRMKHRIKRFSTEFEDVTNQNSSRLNNFVLNELKLFTASRPNTRTSIIKHPTSKPLHKPLQISTQFLPSHPKQSQNPHILPQSSSNNDNTTTPQLIRNNISELKVNHYNQQPVHDNKFISQLRRYPLHTKYRRNVFNRLPQLNVQNPPSTPYQPKHIRNGSLFVVNSLFEILKTEADQTPKKRSLHIKQSQTNLNLDYNLYNNQFMEVSVKSTKNQRKPRLIDNQINRLTFHNNALERRLYSQDNSRPQLSSVKKQQEEQLPEQIPQMQAQLLTFYGKFPPVTTTTTATTVTTTTTATTTTTTNTTTATKTINQSNELI